MSKTVSTIASLAVAFSAITMGATPALANDANHEKTIQAIAEVSDEATKVLDIERVVKTEKLGYDTRVVKDEILPAGVEIVVQEGKPGKNNTLRSFEEHKRSDGTIEKVEVITEEVVELPQERVVRKGTNKEVIDGVSAQAKKIERDKAEAERQAKIEKQERAKAKREAEEQKKEAEQAAKANKVATSERRASYSKPSGNSSNAGNTSKGKQNRPSSSAGGRTTTAAENRAYAKSILPAGEFNCIDNIIKRESRWETTITNPSSGAYGVAQSLPASKYASHGSDWRTNGKTQVRWMIDYMDDRYGGTCNAWGFWQRNHWY